MTIRTQLFILVLVPLVCAIIGAGGIVYTKRVASLSEKGTGQTVPLVKELNDFVLFLQEPPPNSGKQAQYHLQAARNRISSLTLSVKPVTNHAEEKTLIDDLNSTGEKLTRQLEKTTKGSNSLSNRASGLLMQDIKNVFPLIEQLTTFYTNRVETKVRLVNRLNLFMLVTAGTWTLLISVIIFRSLTKPLSQLREAVAALSRGDFSYRIKYQSSNELGSITNSFNKILDIREKADISSKNSEERLKELIENLQMLVVSLDTKGAVLFCNDYLLNVTGYKRHEILGKDWFELFISDFPGVKEIFNKMIEKGDVTHNYQHDIITKYGKKRMIDWNNIVVRDSNGKIAGTTSIGTDITEQHESKIALEQNQRVLSALIDNNPEALFLMDRSGTILTVNKAFADRFNKTRQQVIGTDFFTLFDDPQLVSERRARVEKVFSEGKPIVFDDKRALWSFENHIYPVKASDGRVESVSILSIDITDKCRIESELQKVNEQLRSSNEELEHRVSERTAELTRLNEELTKARDTAEEASRSKSAFLANMSHEIRTPMNAILGLVHLALQTELTIKQREYLDTVNNSAQSLLNIINDILDVSKIESGNLEIEKTDFSLKGVVARSFGILSLKARDKEISLEQKIDPDIPDNLIGDPLRFEQILVNLLGNAIKFTEKGTVTLQIQSVGEEDVSDQIMLEIAVIDTGIGMDNSVINRLFKPFSQGDASTTRNHGGSGLGLTICQRLVNMMGGSIKVESSPGKGSKFSFIALFHKGTLSKQKNAPIDKSNFIQRYQSLKGLHILVAEDHPINRQIMSEILESVGIEVKMANNGREAVQFLQKNDNSIDLVLMDIQMPIMDGYDATREIRRLYSKSRLPIVAMTAHAMQEERERCLAAGMNEHLSKPVVIENLYDMLARLTGRTAKTSSEPVIKDELEHQSILIPEYLPGINIETALSRINGNKRLLGQLIKIFAQDHQGITQEVRHFIADNDTLSAARLVHGLKGVAGNLSAERLQIASANLETALKNKDINASSALLPLLEAALAEVFTAATLLTETATPARTTGTFSSKEISSLLGELQNLLEIHSLDLSSPLDSLRAMLTQGDEHNQIEALAESVQRLDYQKALIILQSLAEKISGNEEQL